MSDLIETFVYFYLIQKVSKSEQNCANFWQIRFSSEFWHFFVQHLRWKKNKSRFLKQYILQHCMFPSIFRPQHIVLQQSRKKNRKWFDLPIEPPSGYEVFGAEEEPCIRFHCLATLPFHVFFVLSLVMGPWSANKNNWYIIYFNWKIMVSTSMCSIIEICRLLTMHTYSIHLEISINWHMILHKLEQITIQLFIIWIWKELG